VARSFGQREALLGPAAPATQVAQSSPWMIAVPLVIVVVVLVSGLVFFQGTERTFQEFVLPHHRADRRPGLFALDTGLKYSC
jgi:hypothetical protein